MLTAALLASSLAALALTQPEAGEARFLTNPTQLTFAEDFVKAGESYFSHDGRLIVFQGVPVPAEGDEPSPHYGMYVARCVGFERLDRASLISKPGSANTCGWFHPTDTNTVVFGSTLVAPSEDNQPGYQRGSGSYRWAFPSEMEVVRVGLSPGVYCGLSIQEVRYSLQLTKVVFDKPGYTAECSYSPDARHILYANVDEEKSNAAGRPDADLWVYDTKTETHTRIVEAEGYDGGPFFSPDGTWICYRSDRRGDNLLQLFVAELDVDDTGAITGITREIQLTDNEHVNWAPFFHPSGDFLVYATSEVSHRNYEVFAVAFNEQNLRQENPRPSTPVRITHADGFDGLPVFTPDGTKMMWTAQRGDDRSPDGRASSQIWIADFDADAVREALAE